MYSTYTRIVYVRIPSQKAPRAKHCRLSHGPPAITALSDEEEDGTVVEIEDEECRKEQEDRQTQQPSSSIPKFSHPVSKTHCSPSPTGLSSPAVQPHHGPAVPAHQDSALVTSAMCWLGDTRKKNQTYRRRLMLYRKGLLSMRGMEFSVHSTTASALSSVRTTTPNELGMVSTTIWNFFCSPFGFYPHCMAATPFETLRTTMSRTELNDEVDFDGVFSNYGNSSPLKIR